MMNKGAPIMDSETGQLYAFDLEDGQPPIMLDSASWKAMRAYADAKGTGPCGKGWVGTKPNCKRGKDVNANSAKAASEAGGLKRIGQGGLNAGNAAKLSALRDKFAVGQGNKSLTEMNMKRAQSGGTGGSLPQRMAERKAEGAKSKAFFAARDEKLTEGKAKSESARDRSLGAMKVKNEASALGRLGKTPETKAGAKLADKDLAFGSPSKARMAVRKSKALRETKPTNRSVAIDKAVERKARKTGAAPKGGLFKPQSSSGSKASASQMKAGDDLFGSKPAKAPKMTAAARKANREFSKALGL